MAGKFAHFLHDPHVKEPITRAPLKDEVEVCILGGGFGGMLAAVRLQEFGFKPEQTRILEKAGGFGGELDLVLGAGNSKCQEGSSGGLYHRDSYIFCLLFIDISFLES